MDIKTKLQVTKFFDNELGVIAKSKVTVTLNKPVYLGMCTLSLNEVLMMSSIMITLKINTTITWDYSSVTLIVWCMKLRKKAYMNSLLGIKKMFAFDNYSA